MHSGRIIFSQLMSFFPRHEFNKCVRRYQGEHRIRTFSCFDQFLCMAFAQLTYQESLRDIEICLRAMQSKLYHAGIKGKVSRSTLADANEKRDWRIYADFAHVLIGMARELYAGEAFKPAAAYSLQSVSFSRYTKGRETQGTSASPCRRGFRFASGNVNTLLNGGRNIPGISITICN